MGKKRDSLALSGGEGGVGKEDVGAEQRRQDVMTNDIGEAAREHKKKKKKRERTEEHGLATGPIENGATPPSQKGLPEKHKDKKDRKEPEMAIQGGAEGRSFALDETQQTGVEMTAEKGVKEGGGKIKKTEKRRDKKEGEGKAGDKREDKGKDGGRGRAALGGAEDRRLAIDQSQQKGSDKAAEKGVEQEGGPEGEGRPEKKRKKKKDGGGKLENKGENEVTEGQKRKEEAEQPPKAPAAAEAGGGGPAQADDVSADVSKREPESGAEVESGKVEGAEEKPVKRRAKKAGAKKEGEGKAKAKKVADGAAEKGRDEAPFDFWGKYFEGRWQGFWRPTTGPGGSPAAYSTGGVKRKGGEEARHGNEGGENGRQGAENGEKESKRQKKEADKAMEKRLNGGYAEPGDKKADVETEGGGERTSKFLIRGPLPCHVEGCRHPARYGKQEGKAKLVPESCSVHKAPGMWEMKTAVCEVAGCAKVARYKYADQKGKSRCAGHKEEGMVN
ncbi:hypothetical protein KFL_003700120 [Klebsormidium nitens]|uniref:Uncharacterized protein n=1 Tax=Klebsormidium nitens TaxID=105231 RepID=A0A1Y1ICJ9_KLENI|nr:hypothetical protein KFL_003700120 [Klebsormidium nitens]|eukprot:GAQ87692.1 hypothetical protein KFL_003700120 [Klebsormidium nitens]